MNVEITSKTDNKLLERKEITAEISFSAATPNRAELRDAISKKLGLDSGLVVMREVKNSFGKKVVRVIAHAYSDKKTLMAVEPSHIQKRDGIVEAKKEEPKKEEPAAKKE
ncbi:hypothetical protein KKF81_02645 [Candidatus Micrarchaeota archaeon]|nr:hypothetical protein [Candidatus Micrarchaeota archaeon]MBU1165820.1 hypothetical protein [Candidatus Micrarchaeota archaeon]MBU1886824.1 hypothetical protein [Candidatus Micrarchaeota archaeon]